MKYMRFTICVLLSFLFLNSSNAQLDQKIGEWRSFLPYNEGRWVTQSPEKIYYSTDLSLFSIDKSDVTDLMFRSKIDGLSEVGIRRIKYDDFTDQLIVVYDNSNIDILNGNEVFNISDIKDNQILTGDRSINDIHIPNKDQIFFATAFGIIELSAERLEFTSTIFTNISVSDLTSNGDILYAATDDGIYAVNLVDNNNIADFSSWELLEQQVGLPLVYDSDYVEVFNGSLYASIDDNLYFENSDGQFEELVLEGLEDLVIKYLAPGVDRLLVGMQRENFGRVIFVDKENNWKSGLTGCLSRTNFAIEDQEGRLWYGDNSADIRWSDSDDGGCHKDQTNSPSSEEASDMDVRDGVLYVASGGVRDNYTHLFSRNGFYINDNDQWTAYTKRNIPELDEIEFLNNFQIETHPSDDRVFIASYYEGLLEYNPIDGTATVYNMTNTGGAIGPTAGDLQRERISGLAFDDNEVLWINNFGGETPLVAYTPEGNWHAFDPAGANQLGEVVIDQNGYTWSLVISSAGGIVVHNSNGTLVDPNDDQSIFINQANSALTTGTVNTIAVDLDGEIWVGTNQGPFIFDSSSSLFDGENLGSQRKVLQDSIAAFLLETEDIRAIAFDGANRKWFGSRNGIFVQSPDGETLVMQFNEDNSPLFDNTINSFKYDEETGIMYIGTNKGLQSFRTETLGAKRVHANKVFAYPNPVRPDYEGPIAIKGLARDANVKITDLNGKLIFETIALGGQAIWDGKDYTGRKASSGVYFVFSTGSASFDTPDTFVTKIMIVN